MLEDKQHNYILVVIILQEVKGNKIKVRIKHCEIKSMMNSPPQMFSFYKAGQYL
jgi:hypothetical protein